MKKKFPQIILLFSILIWSVCANAQKNNLTQSFKDSTIQKLSQLMNDYYVFSDIAKKTEEYLKAQLASGHFKNAKDLESFAKALTESVQSINKDKHMIIRKIRHLEAPPNTIEYLVEDKLNDYNFLRQANAAFKTVKKMDGNVGYLKLNAFFPPHLARDIVDNAMGFLATSDAIIIDLRDNGGGSPETVQHLCSYFFEAGVHLNSLYFRPQDRTEEFWTLENINGERLTDIPLFVLTSARTFSGAEEFSYNMQTQKRATLVGETTGGGANPGGMRRINNELEVFIPTGKAINPITKTNWEGVGVVPEVETSKKKALDEAYELAKKAAADYRDKVNEKYKMLLMDLYENLENHTPNSPDKAITDKIRACTAAKILNEDDINSLGYDYLISKGKLDPALAVFKANTIIYPHSANVYDSYGEALAQQGDLKSSIDNYQKAVEIAKKNNDPQLKLFSENLEKIKKKLNEE